MEKLIKILSFGAINKRHLDFDGTIDGVDYAFRIFLIVPGLIMWGMLSLIYIGIPFLFGMAVLMMILGLSSSIKRYRAVFPKYDPWHVFLSLFIYDMIINIMMSLESEGLAILAIILYIPIFILNMYILFKNTNLKHNG